MAKNPSGRANFDVLAKDYGALDFQDALADFIAQHNHPGLSARALQDRSHNTLIPFIRVPVYHKIKFTSRSPLNKLEIADVVYIRPEQNDSRGRINPARFDTVVVESSKGQLCLLIRVCTNDVLILRSPYRPGTGCVSDTQKEYQRCVPFIGQRSTKPPCLCGVVLAYLSNPRSQDPYV
jgi:hypothetical protein